MRHRRRSDYHKEKLIILTDEAGREYLAPRSALPRPGGRIENGVLRRRGLVHERMRFELDGQGSKDKGVRAMAELRPRERLRRELLSVRAEYRRKEQALGEDLPQWMREWFKLKLKRLEEEIKLKEV